MAQVNARNASEIGFPAGVGLSASRALRVSDCTLTCPLDHHESLSVALFVLSLPRLPHHKLQQQKAHHARVVACCFIKTTFWI